MGCGFPHPKVYFSGPLDDLATPFGLEPLRRGERTITVHVEFNEQFAKGTPTTESDSGTNTASDFGLIVAGRGGLLQCCSRWRLQ